MSLLKQSLSAVLTVFLGVAAAQAAEPGFKQLLAAKDPVVQTEWGARYEHGEGVDQDYALAVRLYCAAAKRGHAPAQYQLGWLYANGRGVKRDDALAAAWFRLAAAKDEPHAEHMLQLLGNPKPRKARCVIPTTPRAPLDATVANSPERRQIERWVRQLAPEYGLDPELVLAVIEAESNFDYQAHSHKNAQGLMQLIPATADRFGVVDILDPLQNLRGGMAYLRWLLAYFRGNVRLTLAGYNAGEQAVEHYGGIPPYPETQAYVANIMRRYRFETHPPVEPVAEPSAIVAVVADAQVQ